MVHWEKKQQEVLKSIPLTFDPLFDIPEDRIAEFEEAVADHLQLHGLNDDGVNDIGRICESILDKLFDSEK